MPHTHIYKCTYVTRADLLMYHALKHRINSNEITNGTAPLDVETSAKTTKGTAPLITELFLTLQYCNVICFYMKKHTWKMRLLVIAYYTQYVHSMHSSSILLLYTFVELFILPTYGHARPTYLHSSSLAYMTYL